MENFCYEPLTLQRLSGHYETGEPMPLDMIQALQKERQFMAGMDTLRQVGSPGEEMITRVTSAWVIPLTLPPFPHGSFNLPMWI